jgi:hypothetical protein
MGAGMGDWIGLGWYWMGGYLVIRGVEVVAPLARSITLIATSILENTVAARGEMLGSWIFLSALPITRVAVGGLVAWALRVRMEGK